MSYVKLPVLWERTVKIPPHPQGLGGPVGGRCKCVGATITCYRNASLLSSVATINCTTRSTITAHTSTINSAETTITAARKGKKLMGATLNQSKIKRSATSNPLLLNRTENGLQIGLQKRKKPRKGLIHWLSGGSGVWNWPSRVLVRFDGSWGFPKLCSHAPAFEIIVDI